MNFPIPLSGLKAEKSPTGVQLGGDLVTTRVIAYDSHFHNHQITQQPLVTLEETTLRDTLQ